MEVEGLYLLLSLLSKRITEKQFKKGFLWLMVWGTLFCHSGEDTEAGVGLIGHTASAIGNWEWIGSTNDLETLKTHPSVPPSGKDPPLTIFSWTCVGTFHQQDRKGNARRAEEREPGPRRELGSMASGTRGHEKPFRGWSRGTLNSLSGRQRRVPWSQRGSWDRQGWIVFHLKLPAVPQG